MLILRKLSFGLIVFQFSRRMAISMILAAGLESQKTNQIVRANISSHCSTDTATPLSSFFLLPAKRPIALSASCSTPSSAAQTVTALPNLKASPQPALPHGSIRALLEPQVKTPAQTVPLPTAEAAEPSKRPNHTR